MNKKEFLRAECPKLHTLEARADGLLDYELQKAIRAISEPLRAEVCRIADLIEKGNRCKFELREIRRKLRYALNNPIKHENIKSK